MPFSPTSALAAKNDEISPETLGLGKDRYFSASSGESTKKNVSCNLGCPLRLTRKNSAVSFWECAGSLHDAENHRIVAQCKNQCCNLARTAYQVNAFSVLYELEGLLRPTASRLSTGGRNLILELLSCKSFNESEY